MSLTPSNYGQCVALYLNANGQTPPVNPLLPGMNVFQLLMPNNGTLPIISVWNTSIAAPTNDQLTAYAASTSAQALSAFLSSQFSATQANLAKGYPEFALVWQVFYDLCTQPGWLATPMTPQQFATFTQGSWNTWVAGQAALAPGS